MAIKIFLSPSDHGVGANRCLHSGCYEDKHTRPIAESCAKYLKENGFDVKIGVANQNLTTRCEDSNKFGADLHVPIHTNAAGSESARYLAFLFYADNDKYRKLFNAIAPAIEEIYPGNKKSVFSVRKDLAEVTKPNATTLYCEFGFHTNKKDCDEFIHNHDLIGKALAKGICKYFGVTYQEKKDEWIKDNVGWWYRHADGSYTKNNWELINNKWYYFDERGYMVENTILFVDGKYYAILPDGHMGMTDASGALK